MSEADDAWNNLVKAEEIGDLEACNESREDFILDFPKDKRAILARYHLGMHFLYRERDSKEAQKWFKEAAQFKNSEIAQEARISYAILLNSQKKTQKAVFELKKILPEGAIATIHTVNALDFLCDFLKSMPDSEKELSKMQETRLLHLDSLIQSVKLTEDKGYYLLRKALCYMDLATNSAKEKAKKTLSTLIKMKESAGQSNLDEARKYLKSI